MLGCRKKDEEEVDPEQARKDLERLEMIRKKRWVSAAPRLQCIKRAEEQEGWLCFTSVPRMHCKCVSGIDHPVAYCAASLLEAYAAQPTQ